ncbi:MAG: S9 family peptidase, partial [Acidobacteria bacterium]
MRNRSLACLVVFALAALTCSASAQDAAKRVPTVDDLMNVKSAGSPQVSPDGTWVAYTITSTDWKQDAYVTHVWLAHVASGRSFQLTRGEKSCSNPQWSPDGKSLAFTSTREGGKNQIFVIQPDGGEAVRLTDAENGAGGYAWSRDGKRIAFTSNDASESDIKARRDYLGDFEVVRKEYAHQHLWTFEVAEAMEAPGKGTERTKGKAFSVSSFSWSPDGKSIAFSATVNPDLINGGTSDIYVLDL